MSSENAIVVSHVGKAFQLYMRRNDQLMQALFGWIKTFYKQHWVLKDVTFEVKKGECVGIIGRNGAGKTTLLQLLCGITRPTKGSIAVNGRVAPILALGSGFDGTLSGRENAMIAAAILGLKRNETLAKMPAIEAFAEIGMFFDQPMKLYSSGMIARLAFAVCANADADILIVDEALSVGDEAFAKKCEDFIDEFAKRGTILVVSHGLDYLKDLCDRVIWIDAGAVREIGPPNDVIPAYVATVRKDEEDEAAATVGG
ncbi:MAG: ABC transporter ATP-binding protein [Hyphomicrobiales bacterium]|nr:ABC transporter ATP-binding protein [Hyphomicrobiales bacterium]